MQGPRTTLLSPAPRLFLALVTLWFHVFGIHREAPEEKGPAGEVVAVAAASLAQAVGEVAVSAGGDP